MIPVHKYVDISHPEMQGKSDWQLWELLNFDAKMMVITEYIGDRIEEALNKIAQIQLTKSDEIVKGKEDEKEKEGRTVHTEGV